MTIQVPTIILVIPILVLVWWAWFLGMNWLMRRIDPAMHRWIDRHYAKRIAEIKSLDGSDRDQ